MAYEHFAYYYDYLMEDVPYEKWVDFVLKTAGHYGVGGKRMLDLACGTGTLAIGLAESGLEVEGLDISPEMLAAASRKAAEAGITLPLYEQDMTAFEGLGDFDMIGCFIDSLNYLENGSSVRNVFINAFEALKPGGILMFDVHTIYKINHIFMNATFADSDEEVSYIWNSFPGDEPDSVEHELTFYCKQKGSPGLYKRFDEIHYQRTFPEDHYVKWLEEAGFGEISSETEADSGPGQAERLFFTAQKPIV
nr:class I SAM-dependent methyltransferase [Bacillus marinisedimentorum]